MISNDLFMIALPFSRPCWYDTWKFTLPQLSIAS